MNKKILLIGVLIIIAIVTVILISFFDKSKNENLNDVKEEIISETIVLKNKISQYENSSKSIDTKIPEFQNLEDGFERNINLRIHNDLNDINVYKNATEGFNDDEIGFFTYETNYDRYNCGNYLSIVANQYIHFGDGRPKMQKKCYVINAATNATVALVDVFENKINYKKAILAEINKQANEKKIELIGGNGLENLNDVQSFYIKDNKLVIYFESSEIAATAVGELEFEMPFEMVNNKFVF